MRQEKGARRCDRPPDKRVKDRGRDKAVRSSGTFATARSCFLSRLSRSPGIVAEAPVVKAGGDEEHRESMCVEGKEWLLGKEGGRWDRVQ